MTTCRNLINEALGSLGAIAPGAEATADEYDSGLLALSNLMGELHAARGPLLNLDVSTDAVAGENQRLRIEGGAIVSVTLPNSISIIGSPYTGDYGHSVSIQQCYLQGSIDPADNVAFRAPSDGARIEVVGTTQSLYFYRADLNAWVIASPLTLDGVSPLNAHFDGSIAAVLAERLSDTLNITVSLNLLKRVGRANSALLLSNARQHGSSISTYF